MNSPNTQAMTLQKDVDAKNGTWHIAWSADGCLMATMAHERRALASAEAKNWTRRLVLWGQKAYTSFIQTLYPLGLNRSTATIVK